MIPKDCLRNDPVSYGKVMRKRLVFSVIFLILAAGTSISCGILHSSIGGFQAESAALILMGGLCGNLPGIIAVLVTFIFRALFDTTSSYRIALYLIAVLLTALAARHRIFRSVVKSVILGALIAAIVGAMNGLALSVAMSGYVSAEMLDDMMISFAYALPESMGSALILFVLFRFLPDRIKVCIPNGIYYLGEADTEYAGIAKEIECRRRESMSTLSFRITKVIILEAIILTLSASIFAIHLVAILNQGPGSVESSVSGDSLIDSVISIAEGGSEDMILPEKPDGEEPPEKPDGEKPPELHKAGVLGHGLEDSISKNAIFNDDEHFNPFEKKDNLSSRTALAFAFRLSMILFTIGVVTAALANAYMQFSVARPIRRMSEAMKGFAYSDRDGSIGGTEELANISIHCGDEIEELYHALVKTVSDTEEYLERLREEDRIRNELEVAKASSDAKSAFLSSMSHEIRTPINAVLGFDEMILMENRDPEIGKYAEDIQSAGKTLLALINDILDFSKLEAGKMEIVPVQYELTSTINDVVSMTMSMANDKGLSFEVNVDPKTPHLLYGDEIRIKQCMTNILSNAVKYTEQGGLTLNVGFEKADDASADESGFEGSIHLLISVKDTGIGIREEDMDKLFSAFDRLDQVRNKAVKGTGLGLSITKQLLEAMGSELKVESEYGKGSDFHFSVLQKVTVWEEIGDLSEAFKKYIPHDKSAHMDDGFYAPNANILVTDDTENNLLVVTRLLKRSSIKIDTADSGKRTLELVTEKKYDLIYLDHMMPEMDGIETLHRMKELEGNMNADTPVIVLTANAVSGSREKYLEEGFTDYMTKPVSYLALKNSLLKYLPEGKTEQRSAEAEQDKEAEFNKEDAEILSKLEGIDVKEGLINAGDEATLLDVIRRFAEAIKDSADRIERELKEGEIRNYTVHVHALKSSARLIGAKELSDLALQMEEAGNVYSEAASEGNMDGALAALDKMEKNTPGLLGVYRDYAGKLAPAVAKKDTSAENDDKPLIAEEELKEMLMAIREFAEAFDMDTVDGVMKQIEGFSLPEGRKEMVAELKKAVQNVDRDAILSILPE